MKKPNVLFITTDQQRYDTIAALGNREIYTPHLNWLADEGISFTNCYSACPLCMPARATIMTGLQAQHHGLTGNDSNVLPMKGRATLPGILTANGYQTRAEGKMHFAPMRACYGFEHIDLPMDYFNEKRREGKASTRLHGVGENEVEPVINCMEERETLTHWIVDRSVDFVENRDPTRPFFLWTSFPKPHPPLDPLLQYWKLYEDAQIAPPEVGDWATDLSRAPLGFYRATFALNNSWRMTEEQLVRSKKAYYACITQIDYNLGILFARMRELNLLENTWIIFTSDHGDMMGDHRMGAKYNHLEGSCHVPLIIKPPAEFGSSVKEFAGQRCEKTVTLADLMPTILSICGAEYNGETDGTDLLRYRKTPEDRIFFGSCENRYFAVIDKGWKYLQTNCNGDELMFHLEEDPKELHDLSKDEAFAEKKEELKALLIREVERSNPGLVENGRLKVKDHLNTIGDVPRFPGLNTTVFPRDSFH
ncbi:sulfatase-like hydrolase/transferase [Caproicibacter sp. BJN0012]|uniref:sulfatase-like hydrolase/transferase n=1 Tax=Caproicibacter sp. BJN0012 TaxID=3110227 RepID=UPI002E15B399|nr:sulfatase-like hydrolase/transferase [Caproicibacter sp. BJN0012]